MLAHKKKATVRKKDRFILDKIKRDDCVVLVPISVGQPYHERDDLLAVFDLLKRSNAKNIMVVLADTLQTYNEIGNTQESLDIDWIQAYKDLVQSFKDLGIEFKQELDHIEIKEAYLADPDFSISSDSPHYLLSKKNGFEWLQRNRDSIVALAEGLKVSIGTWDCFLPQSHEEKQKFIDYSDSLNKALIEQSVSIYCNRKKIDYFQDPGNARINHSYFKYVRYVREECVVVGRLANLFKIEKKFNELALLYPKNLGPALENEFQQNNICFFCPRITSIKRGKQENSLELLIDKGGALENQLKI
jgi:hypothetical protein